jgi:single-strand DNA-binding protein
MNTATLIGRLGQDPVLRHTNSDKAVCEFSLAVDNRHIDTPDWFTIVVWGKLAETVTEHKSKGDLVAVQGRLTPVRWTTDEGQKRSTVKVTAEEINFLGPKRGAAQPEPDEPAA